MSTKNRKADLYQQIEELCNLIDDPKGIAEKWKKEFPDAEEPEESSEMFRQLLVNLLETYRQVEHVVTLRIEKECPSEPMTDSQVAQWVQDQFAGCDYGHVTVDKVVTQSL